jgi:hypothetical protein
MYTANGKSAMAADTLVDAIRSLTPQEQEAVRQFVEYLKKGSPPDSPFLAAVDEFIDRHPGLLHRLAE